MSEDPDWPPRLNLEGEPEKESRMSDVVVAGLLVAIVGTAAAFLFFGGE